MTTQTYNTTLARTKALAAVRICRENCPTLPGVRPLLYEKCLEGVSVFERLRPHVKTTDQPLRFGSLRGQQVAKAFASATLDNVLCVIIDQTPDQTWHFDIITDIPGLVYGAPEGDPGYKTREAAEKAAITGLSALGQRAVPADDYEPIPDPEGMIEIVINGRQCAVPGWPQGVIDNILGELAGSFGHSVAEKTARIADMLVAEFDPENLYDVILLTILTNCGWTDVCRTTVDAFCAAHGIDLQEKVCLH